MAGLIDILGGVLTGGLNLAGEAISNRAQAKENQKQRDFEEKMYNQSVFNDRQNWQMQNMYNLPENQMQRLKQGGLNPNLVYGNGTSTIASPVGNASPTVTNSTKTGLDPNFLGNAANSALQNIYAAQQSNAQVNLLKQETESQIANRNLMATQGALNNAIKNKTELENAFGKDSYNQRLKQLDLANQKAIADIANISSDTGLKTTQAANYAANTQSTIDENRRKWQMQEISLQQALTNIVETKSKIALNQSQIGLNQANTKMAKAETLIKQIDAAYKQNSGGLNLSPHSSGISKAVDEAMLGVAKFGGNIIDWLKDLKLKIEGYDHY